VRTASLESGLVRSTPLISAPQAGDNGVTSMSVAWMSITSCMGQSPRNDRTDFAMLHAIGRRLHPFLPELDIDLCDFEKHGAVLLNDGERRCRFRSLCSSPVGSRSRCSAAPYSITPGRGSARSSACGEASLGFYQRLI